MKKCVERQEKQKNTWRIALETVIPFWKEKQIIGKDKISEENITDELFQLIKGKTTINSK